MIMKNIDACVECEKDVYGDEMNFDCEGNCYCPECYQAIWGSPYKEEEVLSGQDDPLIED
jgi:hypothetical protein